MRVPLSWLRPLVPGLTAPAERATITLLASTEILSCISASDDHQSKLIA